MDWVWSELLHKEGLYQVTDILHKYGIGSATDLSELNGSVASSTVTPPALTSYVALSVGDGVHNEEDVTESDIEDSVSNDSGDRDSDKDYVVIGGKETAIADEEVGNTIGKRAATGGTQTEPL